MAYLNPRVQDFGLSAVQAEATRLDICSQEPVTFAEATGAYSLGNRTAITVGAPGPGAGTARKVTVGAVTGGSVTATGSATHWAVVDVANSRLLAAGPLLAPQAVTIGNEFTLGAFDIALGGVA